ncbi:unnamed protein product [Knipowitschia caucasica]|uniref:Uncharacterized protein n=1 Tax=Knipowitschia caucasica TaxID=637954 RepID=A0AAV2J5M9_KNICA
MDSLLRHYFWLWVVLVVLVLSFIIVLIFVFLNRLISRQGNLTLGLDKKWPSSKFQTYQQSVVQQNVPGAETVSPAPPLSSQFKIQAVDLSYENLCEERDYVDPDEDPEKDPDYEDPEKDPDYEDPDEDPEKDPDYEDPEKDPDYEDPDEDLDLERRSSVPEYLKLETEAYSSHQQEAQDSDYDITAAEGDDGDYDDVG